MTRPPLRHILVLAAAYAALSAAAQMAPEAPALAQQRYERELASCNSGALAAPAREACVRAAGLALDRARGGPPSSTPMPSADGRATVVAPEGSAPPPGASDAVTSRDGRATIVLPAGRTVPQRP